jgi:thymidylate kinase
MRRSFQADLRQPIRIAVSGAHGVGKTTFCLDLQAALTDSSSRAHSVELVKEVARTLRAEGVPINQGTTESQYARFFEKHLYNLLIDRDTDYVIYDRTVLDSLGYARANGNLGESWTNLVTTISRFLIREIDVYFLIPVEFKLQADGIRDTDLSYQNTLSVAISAILGEFGIEFCTLKGSRTERVRRALEIVPSPTRAAPII